jgi:hypothetical protein
MAVRALHVFYRALSERSDVYHVSYKPLNHVLMLLHTKRPKTSRDQKIRGTGVIGSMIFEWIIDILDV